MEETNEQQNQIVIGIDLGTTNSCVGIWRNNNLEIIPDKLGNRTIPSMVAFTNKSRYISYEAKNQIEINPENTFYEVKRLIGKKFDDITVKNDMEFFTFNLSHDENNNIFLQTNLTNRKNNYTPEEISAIILLELKLMAENYLKQKVEKAVITVPAYFNDSQREATKDAARIAGLECIRIINEPIAAALAYGLEARSKNKDSDMNVLVYDLGGGTVDCSVLNISDGIFEVLGCSGNTHMGGADFDNRFISHCMNYFKRKHNISDDDLANLSSISLQKLRKSCEEAKKLLSIKTTAHVLVKDFYDNKNLYLNVTRDEYNNICKDLLIMCIKPIEDALKECNLEKEEIDEIILVGGGTRMIQIRENIKLYFNGKIPNSSVNPDEVVAAGAAIQGYIIENKTDPFSESVVLLDVIPLSLGIETIGGVMTDIIPLNSVIPVTKRKKFTTIADNETSILIKIFQGERTMTKDNFFIGEFELKNIEPQPRGIPQIEVCFSVDVNGIISVTATDLKNDDNKSTLTISGNKGRLSSEKVAELIEEAQRMELIDRMDREKKQYFYEIDELCSNIKTNLASEEITIKESDKKIIMEDINCILSRLNGVNYRDIETKDYIDIINNIKNKYGTLILKIVTNNGPILKGTNMGSDSGIGTSIFGKDGDNDEEFDETKFGELENGSEFKDLDERDKEELLKAKNEFLELCYCIFDIINIDNNIGETQKIEIKDYINDALLWMHVKEKIKKNDYIQKIDEINKYCNEVFANCNTNCEKSYRGELEQLCYALKSSIVSNLLSIDEIIIKELDVYIDSTLKWLVDLDIEKRKHELINKVYVIDENIFKEKIDYINNYCESIYTKFMNVNDTNNMTQSNLELNKNGQSGTSIESLKNNNK